MLDAVEAILPIELVLGTVAHQRPMLTAAPAANAVVTIVAKTRKRQARAPKQNLQLFVVSAMVLAYTSKQPNRHR
jgi:hypothetical protein